MLTLVTGTSCSLGALIACTQNKATSGATVAAALRTAAAAAHTAPGPARPAPPESRCARALRTRASATQRVKAYLGTFELCLESALATRRSGQQGRGNWQRRARALQLSSILLVCRRIGRTRVLVLYLVSSTIFVSCHPDSRLRTILQPYFIPYS
jgi:hypothetical protein